MCIYASYISMDTVHLLSLMDNLSDAWVSIMNCGMTRWSFRWERSMTGHISPVFFGTRKEMAEETLGFWMGGGRWFPLQHDCCQVCVMHGNCLVGSATVGQRWAPTRCTYLAIFGDPSGQLLGWVQTSGRHGEGCWHGKGSQRSIQLGGLMGVIQVMTPLSVCSSLSCWTLQ